MIVEIQRYQCSQECKRERWLLYQWLGYLQDFAVRKLLGLPFVEMEPIQEGPTSETLHDNHGIAVCVVFIGTCAPWDECQKRAERACIHTHNSES